MHKDYCNTRLSKAFLFALAVLSGASMTPAVAAEGVYNLILPVGPAPLAAPTPPVEDKGPIDNSSCLGILTSGHSVGSGIYEISHNGNLQSVYCDMETNGGGWALIFHWVDDSHARGAGTLGGITWAEVAVKGQSMTTYSHSPGQYPALATGSINTFDEQMFKGGTSGWQSLVGSFVSFQMFTTDSFPLSHAGYPAVTSKGPSVIYPSEVAWGTHEVSTHRWGLWPTSGTNTLCGGPDRPETASCPFLRGAANNNHYDYSSQKFLFGR